MRKSLVREISDGDIEFLNIIKLMPPKDILGSISTIHWQCYSTLFTKALAFGTSHWKYCHLALFTNKHVSFIFKQNYQSTNILEHVLILLKSMAKEHIFMNLGSLYKNFSPWWTTGSHPLHKLFLSLLSSRSHSTVAISHGWNSVSYSQEITLLIYLGLNTSKSLAT